MKMHYIRKNCLGENLHVTHNCLPKNVFIRRHIHSNAKEFPWYFFLKDNLQITVEMWRTELKTGKMRSQENQNWQIFPSLLCRDLFPVALQMNLVEPQRNVPFTENSHWWHSGEMPWNKNWREGKCYLLPLLLEMEGSVSILGFMGQ